MIYLTEKKGMLEKHLMKEIKEGMERQREEQGKKAKFCFRKFQEVGNSGVGRVTWILCGAILFHPSFIDMKYVQSNFN